MRYHDLRPLFWAFVVVTILALIFWLFPMPAKAGSCGVFYPSSTVYSPSYVAPVVVEQKVVKQIVFEMVPPYAVGYAPAYVAPALPAPAAAPSPCSEEVKSLRQELEKLKAAIAPAAPAPPPMAPVPERPAAPKATMLGQKCAGCHDATAAATKGGKLTLFEGGTPTAWTPETIGRVIREVASGRMPKGMKLSQDEFTALMNEVMDLASK